MTIKAVVFDIGNVLLEWHPERLFDAEIGANRRKAFFAEADMMEVNEQVDLGAPFHETLTAHSEKHPAWRAEIHLWRDRWLDMCSPDIPHSVRLMQALQKRGVPVYSLSNFGIQTYEKAADRFPFLRNFDRDYVSGHLGAIKPHAPIYEMLERDSGLSAGNLIFTDDRADNIATAAARGWHTHLFEGPQGWADRLVAEGLLRPEDAQ